MSPISRLIIMQMIKWRQEFNMSNILQEDFRDLEQQFPLRMDAVDYIGRPGTKFQIPNS